MKLTGHNYVCHSMNSIVYIMYHFTCIFCSLDGIFWDTYSCRLQVYHILTQPRTALPAALWCFTECFSQLVHFAFIGAHSARVPHSYTNDTLRQQAKKLSANLCNLLWSLASARANENHTVGNIWLKRLIMVSLIFAPDLTYSPTVKKYSIQSFQCNPQQTKTYGICSPRSTPGVDPKNNTVK